ncbi:MAG: BatD family protein [Acetobacter sp.]|nr:BatD family protein [Acetobacter sp.]
MKICNFLLVFFICFIAVSAFAAEVNIYVDKKVITDGDTVRLTIEYDGDITQKPDLTPLQQDFQIVSQASSNYVNFINGQITQSRKWNFDLLPKKIGKIVIKPIKIGNISSNYAEIEVKELTNIAYIPDSRENSNSPFFQIEQSVFPDNPYVQQQVTILVTLYDSIGLQNGAMHLSEDTKKNWSVVPLLNKPIIKHDVVNNKKMNIVTYAFAAFPQKSGVLTTPQISFEGFYLKNKDVDLSDLDDFMAIGFNFQNLIGQKIPVRMRTKTEKIMVQPIPNNFSGKHWLPLKNLTIDASVLENKSFKLEDAISRKLQITATGIQQNMLPQLTFTETSAFKQYPEKPLTTEKVVNGDIVTTAEINTVYIPIKSGKQTLPPIEIEWFNVETQKIEKAIFPAQEIFIQKNPNIAEENISTTVQTDTSSFSTPPSEKTISNLSQTTYDWSRYLSLKLFIVLLFLLILCFLIFKKPQNPYSLMVIKSIKKRDYKEVRRVLLQWANIKFKRSDISNLNMVDRLVQNEDFSKQLSALNKLLYSEQNVSFSGTKFIEIFKKIDKLKYNMRKNQEILPNLYD